MRKSFKKGVLILILFLFAGMNLIYAQQKSLTGKITDSSGGTLPGVTVLVKGTTTGTVTNPDGIFTLSNVPPGATLVISFIGMKTQEILVGNKTTINVTLEAETYSIEEVVAIGYGTQKKQAVTGAVVTADLTTYEKVAANNVMERLKGTVAGLNVGEANTAGGVPGFSIRGQNSIAASNAPLIVMDGAIFRGSMADIPPSDIESVTVLKDASAAAVYGSRSSNGVILIESKKGTGLDGKPKFEFTSSYGFVKELKPLEVYDAKGYVQRLNDILNDNGTVVTLDQTPNYLQTIEKKNYDATPDHKPTLEDPYSLFRRTGFNQNISLSVSNRTEKMNYFMSGNYTSQKGVILNDLFKHYAFRVNLESKVTDWLTLGMKASYSYRDYPQDRIYGAGSNTCVYYFSPYADVYNADGSYNQFPQTTTSFNSPFWAIADEAFNRTHNLNGIFTGTIKVPWVKGLSYTATYSQTLNMNENGSFYGYKTIVGLPIKGQGTRNYSSNNTSLFDHLVKYSQTFAVKHNVDLTLLYSTEKYNYYSQSSQSKGFDNSQLGTWRLQAGQTPTVSSGGGNTKAIGQMARLTYTFNGKYSLTGTFRRDGYSAFSANKKYGDFPSVGMNWNISKESFMKRIGFVDALAIRASYGTNGNQSISPYSTLAKVGNNYYIFQGDNTYTMTEYISSLGNDNLGWESRTGYNLGIDFSVLKNRISGSIDGYATKTNDLAFTLNLPVASGFSTITANAGEIRNKGIEINLSSVNIKKDLFQWTSDVAFSLNRNKIVHLLGDTNKDGKEDDIVSSSLFIGKSLGQIYTYQVTGMYQQEDVTNGTILTGFQPGYYKLLDVNTDGKITSDQDRVFIGNSKENFRWSFTNTFSYGNLSLMFFLNSIWGGHNWFLATNTPYLDGYANRGDLNHAVFDYWTPTNTGAEFPRPSYKDKANFKGNKYYDRSFIRLQKVALSYDITKFVKKYGIQKLDLSVSADNIATFAPHWIGLDAATASGLTDSSIPSLRTLMATLNINF
jgi:TonB-dependent starch-binding outer membrane protein SusC